MISHRGNLGDHVPSREGPLSLMFSLYSFLTELHRRTNFTKVHRDIKSTDSTERYSYCWVLGDRCLVLMISHRGISVITSLRGRGRYLSCSLFILFLTELHRRTNFTKVHRDIKSTDSTERYSYCWVLGDRCLVLMISHRGISVITSLRGRGRYLSSSPFILFSQNYTEELISQRCTETLSQPIAQNVTAIVGCWVIDVRC